ncbi:hypothetical protein ACOSQ3_009319 [Xanthoceras sorbifolium]
MSALPVDLIVYLLCRIPVKSLLRFRCVSKQFHGSLDRRLIFQGTSSELLSVDLDSADNVLELEPPFENWGLSFSVCGTFQQKSTKFCSNFDGSGRDASTDHYKVVKIIHFDRNRITEVTVYRLKANSWRRINDFPYLNYFIHGDGASVEGFLNWMVELLDSNSRQESISLFSAFHYKLVVMVLGGCLCLSYIYPSGYAFDMSAMKEYGVKESWTKLFSF